MIETIPWLQVLLGVAAALSILVIYDVCYVWPLSRRLAATTEKCGVLEERLDSAAALVARFDELENRNREHWSQLAERLGQIELITDTRSYDQAIDLAERGEQADRLIERFGLTEGEADLVRLIHGAAATSPTHDGRDREAARRRAAGSRAA